jgi:hypothetical protein
VRTSLVAGAAALVVVAATAVTLDLRRDREWQHGGDDIATTADVALTTAKTFDTEAVRLGVPPGEATRHINRDQTVVVRVTWSGLPDDGSLELMMMDNPRHPAAPARRRGRLDHRRRHRPELGRDLREAARALRLDARIREHPGRRLVDDPVPDGRSLRRHGYLRHGHGLVRAMGRRTDSAERPRR